MSIDLCLSSATTAWKVPVLGIFLVRIFPPSNRLRKDTMYLSVSNRNAGKYGPEKLRIRALFTHWMVCNLSGFTIILFSRNHFMATLHSDYNFYFNPSAFVAICLNSDAIKINNKKLLKNKLNKVGPTLTLHLTLYFVSYLFRYLFACIVSII